MRYVKTLGLLAVAVAVASMAFAGTPSATTITSSTGETPTIHAVAGIITAHTVSTTECHESTVLVTISEHPNGTPKGSISTLTFGTCTNRHVTVLRNGTGTNGTGTWEIHATSPTGNGIITWNGTRITEQITELGISCIFETQNMRLGTLTGGAGEAILDIESASITRVSGDSGIFCGGNGTLTGTYLIAHPTGLTIH